MLQKIQQTKFLPFIVLLVGILCVSTASIFIRFAQNEASSFVIAAFRMAVSTIVLAPWAFIKFRGEFKRLSKKEWILALLAGAFLACHFAAWITSLEMTSVSSSVVLVTTTPLWVTLASPLVLKERVPPITFVGLGLALAGSVVIGLGTMCEFVEGGLICSGASQINRDVILGNLLALFGALTAAGYMLVGRFLRKTVSLIPYLFLVYGFSAIILIALVLLQGYDVSGYGEETYLWLILLAFVPQLLGHSAFNWSLKHLSASLVSITLLGEPIGSTILAMIFLKENPAVFEISGGVLILSGIVIAAALKQQKSVNAV